MIMVYPILRSRFALFLYTPTCSLYHSLNSFTQFQKGCWQLYNRYTKATLPLLLGIQLIKLQCLRFYSGFKFAIFVREYIVALCCLHCSYSLAISRGFCVVLHIPSISSREFSLSNYRIQDLTNLKFPVQLNNTEQTKNDLLRHFAVKWIEYL